MSLGLYIHIPFCSTKCYYCDFISFPKSENLFSPYIKMLIKEIKIKKEKYGLNFRTVYIGGGTPTILPADELKRLCFFLRENSEGKIQEWTVEANPETITKEKLICMKSAGVNRLSIGAQSFNDKILKAIGRRHTSSSIIVAQDMARVYGFKNINLDLIIGLPYQNLKIFQHSLKQAISLSPEHISLYFLSLSPKSKLYKQKLSGKIPYPSEDMEIDMYEWAQDVLKNSGYLHYEISNFSQPNLYCSHNLAYWENKEYIGVGVGAWSYFEGKRYCNYPQIKKYIENIKRCGSAKFWEEEPDEKQRISETVILGLRLIRGIDLQEFKTRFKEDFRTLFKEKIVYLKEQGLIIDEGERIRLSKKGLLLGNQVFKEFILS